MSGAAALPALVVRFQRTSPTHHRLELVRGDRREAFELETRSCLFHDLVHFAVESEAGLIDSFYGRLARGASYAQLTEDAGDLAALGEIAMTERLVGAVQGAWKSGFVADRFLATFRRYLQQLGTPVPAWLTVELLGRIAQRLRALTGAWGGTPFGETLELQFPPPGQPPPRHSHGGTPRS